MKILAIRFSALGDVAMVAPVLKEYALAHPDDDITMLSKPFCAPIFEGLAPNIHFMGADVKGEYNGVLGIHRLFCLLHQQHFDRICDLHDVLRTKLLRTFFVLHGYSVTHIDKMRHERREITAPEGKKSLRQLKTSFEKYREVLEGKAGATGANSTTVSIDSTVSNSSIDSIPTSSPSPSWGGLGRGVSGRGVALAPFAAHYGKIYPLDKMERVIELLITRQPHVTIYLFGGGGKEREKMQEWATKFGSNVQLASDTCKGLADELRLMQQLDCMVSMDSANMHLASLVGTRVVSIWGATHPFAGFLGYGQSIDDCVQVDLPCRPCSIYGNKPCLRKDYACLNNITPEMIVERIINKH